MLDSKLLWKATACGSPRSRDVNGQVIILIIMSGPRREPVLLNTGHWVTPHTSVAGREEDVDARHTARSPESLGHL